MAAHPSNERIIDQDSKISGDSKSKVNYVNVWNDDVRSVLVKTHENPLDEKSM